MIFGSLIIWYASSNYSRPFKTVADCKIRAATLSIYPSLIFISSFKSYSRLYIKFFTIFKTNISNIYSFVFLIFECFASSNRNVCTILSLMCTKELQVQDNLLIFYNIHIMIAIQEYMTHSSGNKNILFYVWKITSNN